VCTTEILPLLPNCSVLDAEYLYFLLQTPHFVKWATHNASGANLPRLDPKTLEEYRFRLPPILDQKRIADELNRTDRLRRIWRYALQICDEFAPAAFLEAVEVFTPATAKEIEEYRDKNYPGWLHACQRFLQDYNLALELHGFA
jgi:type I restriction enzyme S subunit